MTLKNMKKFYIKKTFARLASALRFVKLMIGDEILILVLCVKYLFITFNIYMVILRDNFYLYLVVYFVLACTICYFLTSSMVSL